MKEQVQQIPGTIVWVAPFYNRSGYGIGARAIVSYLHRSGARIRVVPVDQVEPGIDDCDLDLIKSLENTPVVPPVTAIVTHVASTIWLQMELPEPNLRILATTVFDCHAENDSPPREMLDACRKMDQVWVHVGDEREAFIKAGFPPEKVHTLYWPHPWLDNPAVPPAYPEPVRDGRPFRFLSIAMFLPRRRWDTLIQAYLEEFKGTDAVELYLKVNYPSWHPVPGQPRRDLHDLIASLRRKTGSRAPIIVDEDLGTRLGLLRLIDSCNVYITTDTTLTAPVSEARVRQRLVVLPEGLVSMAPGSYVGIPVDAEARKPITADMLQYQPHHKDLYLPLLHVEDVRGAMRMAFEMSPEERRERAAQATSVPGPAETVPQMIEAIHLGWQYKQRAERTVESTTRRLRIVWEGSQLVRHSLARVNRELCLRLIDAGHELSIIPFEKDDMDPDCDPRFEKIVRRTNRPLSGQADVHVKHRWPPDLQPPDEGHWVMIQPWEFGSLPELWVGAMRTMVDEMWVPSLFVRKSYIKSGVPAERVFVVPNGVDTEAFSPDAPPITLSTRKRFKFLFVGGTVFRKGIDVLLDAYVEAFSSRDDVCLVIKDMGGESYYKDQTSEDMIRRYRNRPGAPEIEYTNELLDERDMPGLYTACDCLVHPYRGEGFGLPIAEAMSCSLPVIVTGHGAALDFCSADNAFLLPFRILRSKEKRVGEWITVDCPSVAEPDRRVLKDLMRYVYENPQEAKIKGEAARARMEADFTWDKAFEMVEKRLQALADKPIVRFTANGPVAEPVPVEDRPPPESCSPDFPEPLPAAGTPPDQGIEGKDARAQTPREAAPTDRSPGFERAEFLNREGERRFRKNEMEKARAFFEMALEHDSNHAKACNNLGVFHWRQGDLEKALEYLYKALELAPEDPDILYNGSRVLAAAGETASAIDILRLYLQRNPRDEQAWEEYDSLLVRQVDERARGNGEVPGKDATKSSADVGIRERKR